MREYRSASIVASAITLTSVSNYNNISRSHKVRYAHNTVTVQKLYIDSYCTLNVDILVSNMQTYTLKDTHTHTDTHTHIHTHTCTYLGRSALC